MKFFSLIAAMALAGCSTWSADGGMAKPAELITAHTGAVVTVAKNDADLASIRDQVDHLLGSAPLSEDVAVKIALINNRTLQATYSELGVAEADLVQAGRLSNPGFSFNHTRGNDSTVIDRTLTFNIINLITMPLASRIESSRFDEVKLRVADSALTTAAAVRIAYVEAIAAQQRADYATQVQQAANASLDLANRMVKAGNWSELELQREQMFFAQANEKSARAAVMAVEAKENLTQLLGLATSSYGLPDHLPAAPASPLEAGDMEAIALRERLDIAAAQLETKRVAAELGLTKAVRFVNVLEVGPALNTGGDVAPGAARAAGYQINLEIPLFDWGDAKTARAEALYMQSAHRLAAKVVNAQSQVRAAYADYRAKYEIARQFRDEIVPLQKKISAENLLRYNGMLISIFDLLADARAQIDVVNASVNAQKEFWIADARLQIALGGSQSQSDHQGDSL